MCIRGVAKDSPRAPTLAKIDHKEPDHSDGCPSCCFVRSPLVPVFGEDDGNGEMRDAHA